MARILVINSYKTRVVKVNNHSSHEAHVLGGTVYTSQRITDKITERPVVVSYIVPTIIDLYRTLSSHGIDFVQYRDDGCLPPCSLDEWYLKTLQQKTDK